MCDLSAGFVSLVNLNYQCNRPSLTDAPFGCFSQRIVCIRTKPGVRCFSGRCDNGDQLAIFVCLQCKPVAADTAAYFVITLHPKAVVDGFHIFAMFIVQTCVHAFDLRVCDAAEEQQQGGGYDYL